MPEPRRLHLRTLYTINSSSYILARSLVPVLVTPISDGAVETEPYGSVSFKTCLEAICRSSPELVQDRSRDFSVYVLDPLESNAAPAPMDISNSASNFATEQSRGVAVGMGLMSLALSMEEKDPVMVVGTLGKTGTGQDAIEVIIALRETACVDQAKLPRSTSTREMPQHSSRNQASTSRIQQSNTSTSSETLATIASIQTRMKAKNKPKKPSRTSSTPMTESDKLLSANTYIGPVKKKGRPKGGSAADVKIKQEELSPFSSQDSAVAPPSQVSSFRIGTSTTTTTIQSTTNTSSSHSQTPDPNAPSATGGMDLAALAALFSANQSETAQNAFLLNTLNLIDSAGSHSGSQTPTNIALVEALGQLLKNAYVAAQLQPIPAAGTVPSIPESSAQPAQTVPPREEDIVLLDKENVNPSAFKRCAEREYEQIKLVGNNARASNPDPQLATDLQTERQALQNRGLGARSIENSPPKTQPTVSGPLSTTSMLRKRTLDDCMEERDNKRNKNHRSKGKERERADKESSRFLLSQRQNHGSDLRHYPRILASILPRPETRTNYYRTGVDAWTSPPRPTKQRNANLAQPSSPLGGTSPNRPIIIPDSPHAPRVSASSPIKPANGHKKTYVVPSWARTNTATQPRLSEDAQRAAEVAAQKKREERRANRRKTNAAAQERSRQRGRMVNSDNTNASDSELAGPPKCMRPPPQSIIPKSDLLPIIASSDAGPIFFPPPDQRLRSPSPSPTPRSRLPPPVTPKQLSKVASSTPGTTEYDGDSLFTPLSIARRSTGTGSPLLSPGIFGSPLARKRSRVTSHTYRSIGKHPGSESSTTTVKAPGTSEDSPNKSNSPTCDNLDEALDDLECPPSSLPIASSDIEIDDTTAQNVTDANEVEDNSDDEDLSPRTQHWVGLPPSSPPPPTSPGLMPVDDDFDIPGGNIDDGDLPIASETDEPEDEFQEPALSNAPESDWAPDPDANDSEASMLDNSPGDFNIDQETVDELAFFEQFTAIGSSDGLLDIPENHQGDPGPVGGDLDSLFPGGFDNMDLNGFLETFRPLIHQDGSIPDTADPSPIFDFCNMDGAKDVSLLPQPFDHAKLAEDLQALLGGCLV